MDLEVAESVAAQAVAKYRDLMGKIRFWRRVAAFAAAIAVLAIIGGIVVWMNIL